MKVIKPLCRPATLANYLAFTLTDLLVTLGTAVVVVGLLVPMSKGVARRSSILECKDNLRAAGVALDGYRQDHSDRLPGPLWRAVYYTYRTNDVGIIGNYLATYLGAPAPDGTTQQIDVLRCPAATQVQGPPPIGAPSTTMLISYQTSLYVTNWPGSPSLIRDPFGYPYSQVNGTDAQPMFMSQILRPSECWGFVDADQRNSYASPTSGYGALLPTLPVHNNRPGGAPKNGAIRNHLFFDGNVQSVSMSL